ncbi:MAG TPA: hypothetical protein VNV17_04760 [Solirubrobacteraceae bacterium]|nr:hypothetical protein [Solirubrobacteraceae bacterium]
MLALSIDAWASAPAGAAVPGTVWMTPDTARPSVDGDPSFLGSSKDGSTAFFLTAEPLTGVDPGPTGAIFASHDGTLSLVAGGSDGQQPELVGSSLDGSVVFYRQAQPFTSTSWGYDLVEADHGVAATIAACDVVSPGVPLCGAARPPRVASAPGKVDELVWPARVCDVSQLGDGKRPGLDRGNPLWHLFQVTAPAPVLPATSRRQTRLGLAGLGQSGRYACPNGTNSVPRAWFGAEWLLSRTG